jgi:SAM-dependent methyltransferase
MSEQNFQPSDPPALPRMTQLIFSFMASQAVHVAAKLGVADLVKDGPKTADELALATSAHAPSLRRLLLLLASLGVFAEDAEGRFQQTPLSSTLRSDTPESIRNLAIMFGMPFLWKAWDSLHDTVMTGQPAFERAHGANFFEYLTAHPDDAAIFNAAMSATSSIGLSSIVESYDFSQFERIVDVGGGHGALLSGILTANPKLRGVLADRSEVVAGASVVRSGPLADRCEVRAINFFEAVPEGADAYLMKSIVHDWNDEHSLKILKNCRRAIQPNGKLLLIEMVLRTSNQPDPGRFMDLNMLTLLTGKERTEADFRVLLAKAGFSLARVIPTAGMASIIESRPV